jgi:peptide/nickel transport system substrate-binding protein/oligopeptide transport system substrate-binding protein
MAAYNQKPIGDGPYQMDGSWRHDESISMTAYPRYAGQDRPRTRNLVFKLYSNADTAYTDVLAGNTDLAGVPADRLNQFKRDFGSRWLLRGGLNIEYLAFPLFDPRWQDKRLRQAVSLAIDRAAINKALFGGVYGNADSFLPPSTPGGNPHSCRYCRFDPAKAKQLLAQAGGFSGKMVVTYLGGYGLDQEYQAIANQLRQNLGIDVVAQPSATIAAFYTNLSERKYRSGPLYGSWGSSFPSAQAVLAPNFTRGGIAYDGVYYSSPAVDRLIAKGNAAPSPAAAARASRAAEARIQADFPAAPLFFLELPMVHSKRVAGVRADALANPVYTAIRVAV